MSEDYKSCLPCEYPCSDCRIDDRGFCLSCVSGVNRIANDDGECECFNGYTDREDDNSIICYPSEEFC